MKRKPFSSKEDEAELKKMFWERRSSLDKMRVSGAVSIFNSRGDTLNSESKISRENRKEAL